MSRAHMWGDGFDFALLNEAGEQIANIYYELTGVRISWKEKYGQLRFEWKECWLYPFKGQKDWEPMHWPAGVSEEEYDKLIREDYTEEFMFAVLQTVCDYPELADEILSDWLFAADWAKVNSHRKRLK